MNRIDEIFRKGLSDKGFEYTDSYWSDMEKLLPANEKRVVPLFRFKSWIWLLIVPLFSTLWFLNFSGAEVSAGARSITNLSAKWMSKIKLTKAKEDEETKEDSNLVMGELKNSEDQIYRLTPSVKKSVGDNLEISDKVCNLSQYDTSNQLLKGDFPEDLDYVSKGKPNFNLSQKPIPPFSENRISFYPLKELDTFIEQKNNKTIFSKVQLEFSPLIGYVLYKPVVISNDEIQTAKQILNSPEVGLRISAGYRHLTLQTGFSLFTLKEKTNYKNPVDFWTYDTSIVRVQTYYSSTNSGNRIDLFSTQIDSNRTVEQEDFCPGCLAQFRYVNIPLQLGYEFRYNRLQFSVAAGSGLMLMQKSTGFYQPVSKDNGNLKEAPYLKISDQVKMRFVELNTSIGINYWMSSRIGVSLNYKYSRSMQSMFLRYDVKPEFHRIQLGLTYRIH
ncbi:MAG: hypothetical protein GC181_09820 [Bacteroidetes bacterium]|nr:hypothetical protein [Bacteroidota bacterium]